VGGLGENLKLALSYTQLGAHKWVLQCACSSVPKLGTHPTGMSSNVNFHGQIF